MNPMKNLLALAVAACLTACAMPTTQVSTGAPRPTLIVQGAPADAILYVDGLAAGNAAQYNGVANSLLIEEGVHHVELRRGASVLMAQKIFASNGESSKLVYASESTK